MGMKHSSLLHSLTIWIVQWINYIWFTLLLHFCSSGNERHQISISDSLDSIVNKILSDTLHYFNLLHFCTVGILTFWLVLESICIPSRCRYSSSPNRSILDLSEVNDSFKFGWLDKLEHRILKELILNPVMHTDRYCSRFGTGIWKFCLPILIFIEILSRKVRGYLN